MYFASLGFVEGCETRVGLVPSFAFRERAVYFVLLADRDSTLVCTHAAHLKGRKGDQGWQCGDGRVTWAVTSKRCLGA